VTTTTVSWDDTVRIVTVRGSFLVEAENFFHMSRPSVGSPILLAIGCLLLFSHSGAKQEEREADHCPPFSAKFQNVC
jgi:hypothetical protein